MAKPIVSVLIPVYNVERYLERCLDSVTAQTLNNIEIICVDDGSTDNSIEILKRYSQEDKRIKIVQKRNGGLPSARNAGLDVAKGTYIGFVDSDDYIETTMYEKMVCAAKERNSDVVICGANIFPEEPKADQWLYDSLSPFERYYEKFNPDILFKDIDTTPFLWRTLIRRGLIEEHKFRLNEDIVLGEDKAFQCKIYPYAKGITVIQDKLYNYYWCRPGSLMEKTVYGVNTTKTRKHVELIEEIAEHLYKLDIPKTEKTLVIREYIEWALPFIYKDFLYSSVNDKIDFSQRIFKLCNKLRINQFVGFWEEWRKQQYLYIKSYKDENKQDSILLSIIIPGEGSDKYIGDFVSQIQNIAHQRIELIFVNNGISDKNYIQILELMKKKKEIRLFNTPKHMSYAELLNQGLALADGRYVLFWEPKDGIGCSEKISEWLTIALENEWDCCICNHYEKVDSGVRKTTVHKNNILKLWDADFHDALIRKGFLEENKILFSGYSILTGLDFWARIILEIGSIGFYDDFVYCHHEIWTKDWLETEKCELLLDCLIHLMQLSLEYQNAYLHGKIIRLLNSDRFRSLLVNGTKMYRMSIENCPNGENGQINIVSRLYSIVQKVDCELLKKSRYEENYGIVDTLYEVITERQRFLAEI